MLKKVARKLLMFAEWFYLYANGWEKVGVDQWNSPTGYESGPKLRVHKGHAVNSMKQRDLGLRIAPLN